MFDFPIPSIDWLTLAPTTTLVAVPVCMLVGFTLERVAYRPLRNAPRLAPLITAIGVSLLLEYTGQVFFGAAPRTFPAIFPVANFQIGSLVLSSNQLIVIIVAVGLMLGLGAAFLLDYLEDSIRGPEQFERAAGGAPRTTTGHPWCSTTTPRPATPPAWTAEPPCSRTCGAPTAGAGCSPGKPPAQG